MNRELDIVLFGATGFTGKHVVSSLLKFCKSNTPELRWGVAGRSQEKLENMLTQCAAELGTSLGHIPLIIANISEEKTLNAMARKARVVINCCGPYQFLGEPVVKACVEEGTHHIDVSGEPQYMEKMQLKYHDQAKEKGIYIISACGIDSIPADLGVVFLERQFNGTLNSVETYLDVSEEENSGGGPVLNIGTWESAVYVLAHTRELKEIRKKLFPTRLPDFKPKLGFRLYPHKSNVVKGWVLPFLGSDRSVIRRSQRYFYVNDAKRPIQAHTYLTVHSFVHVILLAILGTILLLFSACKFGINLLLKYPEILSLGLFSREPPSEEKIESSRFSVTLYGEGWKETVSDPDHEFATPPNKAISVRVKGRNPGYGATSVFLVLCAITVITERGQMPPSGGVYPPGYAFAKTSLIEQIDASGINFEVLQEKNLYKC